jgi:hypothetical protein
MKVANPHNAARNIGQDLLWGLRQVQDGAMPKFGKRSTHFENVAANTA